LSTVPIAGRSRDGFEVEQIGDQQNHLEQQIEIGLILAETLTITVAAPASSGCKPRSASAV
jgi:hypothetical protein